MKMTYDLDPIKRMKRREFLKGVVLGGAGTLVAIAASTVIPSLFKPEENKPEEKEKRAEIIKPAEPKKEQPKEESKDIVELVKKELGLNPQIKTTNIYYLELASFKYHSNAESWLKKFNKQKYSCKIEKAAGFYHLSIRTFSKEIADWLAANLRKTFGKTRVFTELENWEFYSKDDLEKIVDYFANENRNVFRELAIDSKRLFRAITKAESNFDPNKVAHKISEVYDKKKKNFVAYKHKKDGNGNKIITAIGLMQIGVMNRHLFSFTLDEYFHPIKNAYMGAYLLVDAAAHLKENGWHKESTEERVKHIAFIYNAGAANYEKWKGIPKKKQTKDFMEDVLRNYKSV